MRKKKYILRGAVVLSFIGAAFITNRFIQKARYERRYKNVMNQLTARLHADPSYVVVSERDPIRLSDPNTIPLSVLAMEGYERTPLWLIRLNLHLPSRLKINPDYFQEDVKRSILILVHVEVFKKELQQLKNKVDMLNSYQDIQIDIRIGSRGQRLSSIINLCKYDLSNLVMKRQWFSFGRIVVW